MPDSDDTPLALPDVTLVCADCAQPDAALLAMSICLDSVRFGRALFFTDAAVQAPPGIEVVAIPRLASRVDYSRFMIKDLAAHVDTGHALVVQWDGFVAQPLAWRPLFLQYDYIGAVWYWHQDAHRVGNGGFSLRSRRLLQALQDPRIVPDSLPEDDRICRRYRPLLEEEYGIAFAPEALARLFAYEREEPAVPTFGFHGVFNLHRHSDDSRLPALIRALPAEVLAGEDGVRLLAAVLADGRMAPAGAWAERLVQGLGRDRAVALLGNIIPAHIGADRFLDVLLAE